MPTFSIRWCRFFASIAVLSALFVTDALTADGLDQRLMEAWRWREIPSSSGTPFFCIDTVGDELIACDRLGIVVYDGYQWGERIPFGSAIPAVSRVRACGDGLLLRAARTTFFVDRAGHERYRVNAHFGPTRHPDGGSCVGASHQELFLFGPDAATTIAPPPHGNIRGVGYDSSGELWVATTSGLYRDTDAGWRDETAAADYRSEGGEFQIIPAGDELYIFANESRAEDSFIRFANGVYEHLPTELSGRFLGAVGDRDGSAIVALSSGKVDYIHGGVHKETSPPLAFGAAVSQLGWLAEHRLVMLSVGGRVWVCDLMSDRWESFRPPRGGLWQHINAISPAAQGGLWLATGGGVVRFADGEFEQWIESSDGTSLEGATAIHEDSQGGLWIGSGSSFAGARYFGGGSNHGLSRPESVGVDLDVVFIHAIRPGPDDDLWFLTLGGDTDGVSTFPGAPPGGVIRFQRGGGWSRLDIDGGKVPVRTYDVAIDAQGRAIVATNDGVAVQQSAGSDVWERPLPDRDSAFSVHVDQAGFLWVGRNLHSRGVERYDLSVKPAAMSRVIPEVAGGSFVDTVTGQTLIASSAGLFAFDGERTLEVTAEPGIPATRFWPMIHDPHDTDVIWLGSLGQGLIRYHPDDHHPPRITNLSVVGTSDGPSAMWSASDRWYESPVTNLVYETRTDGGKWVQVGHQDSIRLKPAGHGDHSLEVRAIDLAGNVSEIARCDFHVMAPFYVRAPFLVVAGGFLVLLSAAAVTYVRRKRSIERVELRRQAELHASESHFRGLVEHSTALLTRHDVSGKLIYVSPHAQALIGFSVEAILANPRLVDARVHPEDRAIWRELWEHRQGHSTEEAKAEYRMQHADGSWLFLRTWQKPRLSPENEFLGTDSVTVDLTEVRHAEASRQRSRNLESLGLLAGGVAHDFNNLLVGIRGNADLARLGMVKGEDLTHCIDEIEKASESAADLCRQMLTFAGRAHLQITDVDLARVVTDTLALAKRSLHPSHRIDVVGAEATLSVRADIAQLRQLVMNLILNASEAMTPTSEAIVVRLERQLVDPTRLPELITGAALPTQEYAVLSIEDDGPGIDSDTRQRMFEPFFSTKGVGRGLGLAGVIGIVRGHHAALTLESRVGEGSRFTVYIPTAKEEAKPTPIPSATQYPQAGTFLLIDDDVIVSKVAERALRKLGFDVVSSLSGRDGIARFRAAPSELRAALIDVTLPDISGTEVFQQIRATSSSFPVILTSGYDRSHTIDQIPNLGPYATFLPKPWTITSLQQAIDVVLGSAGG